MGRAEISSRWAFHIPRKGIRQAGHARPRV